LLAHARAQEARTERGLRGTRMRPLQIRTLYLSSRTGRSGAEGGRSPGKASRTDPEAEHGVQRPDLGPHGPAHAGTTWPKKPSRGADCPGRGSAAPGRRSAAR
jgi:hypothetical protein